MMRNVENLTDFRSIDLANAGRLLRRIEAHHDAEGWHNGPHAHVYAIYDHHDVVTAHAMRDMVGDMPAIRNSRYTAQLFISPRVFDMAWYYERMEAIEALHRFVHNTAYGDVGSLPPSEEYVADGITLFRRVSRMAGILGFACSIEAYGAPGEQVQAAIREGRHVGTSPGAQETRTVMMADASNRIHEVNRVRGEPAELLLDLAVSGGPANLMRLLMDFAMDRLPQTDEEYRKRYPNSREEIIRRGCPPA